MTRRSLLTGSLLLLAAGDLAVGQEPTNQLLRDTRQHDRVLVPVLEVREFSGEFERWGREMTVKAPKAEVFRWSTPVSGTASATWSVLDGAPGSGSAVVGSGSAGSAPQAGSVAVFRIDFRKFFPAGPPAGGTTYWVVVEPVDAAGQVGPESMPVQVNYAAPVDPAAFAGREGDVVAPTQIAMSKTSKLAFLQDLVAKSVELLLVEDVDGLEAAAATGDIPDAQIRLTPREPRSVDVEAGALPKIYMNVALPHYLRFIRMSDVRDMPSSPRAESPRSGVVGLFFSLVPDQLYLLVIGIESAGLTLELDSPAAGVLAKHRCPIDLLLQKKIFQVPAGPAQLVAIIKRSDSLSAYDNCGFVLHVSPPPPTDGSRVPICMFFSA